MDGNLTLESNYTLTSIKSGTAVGNGLLIYCGDNFTVNGIVNMNGVSNSASGKILYMFKNGDGSYSNLPNSSGKGGNGANSGTGAYGTVYVRWCWSSGTYVRIKE